MRQFRLRMIFTFSLLAVMIFSCTEEGVKLPTQANIYFTVVGKKVAFTALAINADTFLWDFGDGSTSEEKNPVHYYEAGGTYIVKLTVTGPTGSDEAAVEVSVALSPYEMLTGGVNAANGKTWKINSLHPNDELALADPDMTNVLTIPSGAFSQFLGLEEVYQDEFTFYYDGTYKVDGKGDGGVFAGLVHAMKQGANILKTTPDPGEFPFCTMEYTIDQGATFSYNEDKDLTITSVTETSGYGDVTYSGVNTLSFSGNGFVGIYDAKNKDGKVECIVQEITNESMRIAVFMSLSPDFYDDHVMTHVMVITLEVVK